jgi:hypothetical protein
MFVGLYFEIENYVEKNEKKVGRVIGVCKFIVKYVRMILTTDEVKLPEASSVQGLSTPIIMVDASMSKRKLKKLFGGLPAFRPFISSAKVYTTVNVAPSSTQHLEQASSPTV